MPNWCFTNYIITGDETEISDLFEKLSSLPDREDVKENGFGKFWLGNVVGLFGGNWETINCRGSMSNLERQSPTEIQFDTETAWGDMPEVWDFVFKSYKTLKYYYYAEESGNCYYQTNDAEGKYFPDRFVVDQWDGERQQHDSEEEALNDVSELIGRPLATWGDMLAAVEDYNKDNEGTEIHVHEISVRDSAEE